jgi:hypothetical protein
MKVHDPLQVPGTTAGTADVDEVADELECRTAGATGSAVVSAA